MANIYKALEYKFKHYIHNIRAKGHTDLTTLGKIFKTDKVGLHFYTSHYSSHFHRFRDKEVNLLEIGVGGYKNPYKGGKSLRMWKKYFPLGNIYSIDIYDKAPLQEDRITIFKGSQTDEAFLLDVINRMGEVDIIVDDGSHVNDHVIKTFNILFPKLKDGGIYVVEDVQTSYWADMGGDSESMNNPKTIMGFFKNLTDSLNNKEFLIPNYVQNYYDKKITSMHFYHNLIFIYKGNNDEESNVLVNNQK